MTSGDQRADTRTRIIDTAARLLREEGTAAVTTRRVAEDAGVQPPAIYRLFGDKDGLLDAVAEHVLSAFVAAKEESIVGEAARGADPVDDLRRSWDTQIEFALGNPSVYGMSIDPFRDSAALRSGTEVLRARVDRIGASGRLRVGVERAVQLIQSAGSGVILSLLRMPTDERDLDLADDMWRAVLARIVVDPPGQDADGSRRDVSALSGVLSEGERILLTEWSRRSRRPR